VGPDGYQEPEETPFGVIRTDPFAKTVSRPRKKDEPETPHTQAPDDKKRKSVDDTPTPVDKKTRL
jgi:hypothetical protein